MDEDNDRTVISVFGKKGNEGKSTCARKLVDLNPNKRVYLTSGKAADLAYIINSKDDVELVCIDLSRCNDNYIGLVEMVKNGYVQSNKYQSISRCLYHNVQVVIFSNTPLDVTKLSMDRWEMYELFYRHDLVDYHLLSEQELTEVNRLGTVNPLAQDDNADIEDVLPNLTDQNFRTVCHTPSPDSTFSFTEAQF